MTVLRCLLCSLLLLGCQTEEYPAPIPGSAYRIGADEPAKDSEMTIDVFATPLECAINKIDDEACVPMVDRAHGEVRVAFDVKDPTSFSTMYRSIDRDYISVAHDGRRQDDFELIPHDPVAGGQLYILLIDGSGSMYDNEGQRIKQVYNALMTPSVIDGFFPDDASKSGVVLLRFSGEVVGLDGGEPQVLTSAREYRQMVKTHLMKPSGGYTHLFGAVRYGVTELLAQEKIATFLAVKSAEPTLVVLTDGFNNEAADDTCGTNAPRLQETLDVVRDARRGAGVGVRPTVYTVGLGRPISKKSKPSGLNQTVTPQALCGKYVDNRIDGGLEEAGIDHISLQWIAEVGGGSTFVKSNPRGLADVFRKASAARFRWYELRYKVPDSFYHRKSFELRISLLAYARAFTTVRLYPSAWIDAPTAHREVGAKWSSTTPLRQSLALLMPILGLLVFINFLGPAFFNARRAIFRRARRR